MVLHSLEKALPWYKKAASVGDELGLNFMGAYEFNVNNN